jgi:hypothetical protein
MTISQNPLFLRFLIATIACLSCQGLFAVSPDARACNLQGREIAFRISKEISSDLSADDRARIAAIAEEVCGDYSTAAMPLPTAGMPVVSRPAVTAPAALDKAETGEDEEGGLLDIKIIDPDDRVKRPGLKRP